MSTESAFITNLNRAFPDVESCDVDYSADSVSVMLPADVEILINRDAATANGPGAGRGYTVEVIDGDGVKIGVRSAISQVDGLDIAKRLIDRA